MSATEPTRKPWHSGTDAIWADSAAVADAESAPSNGEIVAGHVEGTGLTSGRANWLFAAMAEWLQRVRDTLLPQHTDSGDHVTVRVTPSASGQLDMDLRQHASDAASLVKWRLASSDAATVHASVSQDRLAHSGEVRTPKIAAGNTTAAAAYLQVVVNDPGTSDSLLEVRNESTGVCDADIDGAWRTSYAGAYVALGHKKAAVTTLNTGSAVTSISLGIPDGAVLVGWAALVSTAISGTDATTFTLAMTGGSTLTLGTLPAGTLNSKRSGMINPAGTPMVSGSAANATLTLSGGSDNVPSAGAVTLCVWYHEMQDMTNV